MVEIERLNYFLDRARNGLDKPITPESRARLLAAVCKPCHETWTDAHGVILGGENRMTLWVALTTIQPPYSRTRIRWGTPATGPARWLNLPSAREVATAIRYATS